MSEIINKSIDYLLIFLDNKFEWFYLTVVTSVRKRFNQGLLFDINANKVILERLNASLNENENSERISKELDVSPNNPSLSEIVKEGFTNYQNNNMKELKIVEEGDIFEKVKFSFFKSIRLTR